MSTQYFVGLTPQSTGSAVFSVFTEPPVYGIDSAPPTLCSLAPDGGAKPFRRSLSGCGGMTAPPPPRGTIAAAMATTTAAETVQTMRAVNSGSQSKNTGFRHRRAKDSLEGSYIAGCLLEKFDKKQGLTFEDELNKKQGLKFEDELNKK